MSTHRPKEDPLSSDVVVDSIHMIIFGGIAMTASALHRATGGHELTFTQWRAIFFVGESRQGSRVSDVAARLMGSLSATSRLLRRLEERGFVTLDRDETDRRATRARLTVEGERIREAVLAYRRQEIADIAGDATIAPDVERALLALAARFEAYGREVGAGATARAQATSPPDCRRSPLARTCRGIDRGSSARGHSGRRGGS
jgi:DNA-binding MarR family transcriptional regulator